MTTPADTQSANADDVESPEVFSLYTPAMLAELVEVPVQAVRRWYRLGYLQSQRHVRRLPCFEFTEIAVARHLATLLNAGCSQPLIDRKLEQLRQSLPDVARPLSDPTVLVSGRQLIVRRGDDLSEPGGQLLIDFDYQQEPAQSVLSVDTGLSIGRNSDEANSTTLSACNQLQIEALKWEDRGELGRAAEVYRTLLMANQPTAEVHFALADLLYRMGDLAAARERFYAAIELDEEYVEARASLGCVLAESGELELAVAAFQGALAFDADYADVHYHLANALDLLGNRAEAEMHWQLFLRLAPDSPWAEAVRNQLSQPDCSLDIVLTP